MQNSLLTNFKLKHKKSTFMEIQTNKCSECEEIVDFREVDGRLTCPSCGAQHNEAIIDAGNDWRDFETEDGQTNRAWNEVVSNLI